MDHGRQFTDQPKVFLQKLESAKAQLVQDSAEPLKNVSGELLAEADPSLTRAEMIAEIDKVVKVFSHNVVPTHIEVLPRSVAGSKVITAFAALAVVSSLLNVWFVSGGGQKMAMKNLPLTAQKSQAWNLDDGIAFCQDLKSTMASAREAMDNSSRLGYEIQYFDMAAAAYKDAYASFYENNCDAISYMLE